MFTTSSQPSDNVDIVDRTRAEMQKLHMRRVRLILSWIPGHVGIPGNEEADTQANLGAEEALRISNTYVGPAINSWVGISYGVARAAIRDAAFKAKEHHWDMMKTTLKL